MYVNVCFDIVPEQEHNHNGQSQLYNKESNDYPGKILLYICTPMLQYHMYMCRLV